MTDNIPDEVWIDVVAAVGWDESNELWPVLQTALAAALPVLNTARDASPDVQSHDEYRRLWMHRFDALLSNADVLDEDDQLAVLNVHEALLAEQYHNHRAVLASRDSETAELRRRVETLEMFEQEYLNVSKILDTAHGPNEDDGAGAGIAADVHLLMEQRDQARAALDRVRAEHEHTYLDAYYHRTGRDKAKWARCKTCGNLPNGTLDCPTLAAASLRGEQ